MQKSMGERLRAAREAANYPSATKAAEALGVSLSTYRAHENGQNEFSAEVANRYAKKFGTTAAYLLTGEGLRKTARPAPNIVMSFDPDEQDHDGFAESGEELSYSREHWKPQIEGATPEVDVKLGAGSGVVGEVINLPVGSGNVAGHKIVAEWLIPTGYLRNEAKASPSHTIIMEVVGDSMQPTYMPGDRVIVDLSQNQMTTDTVYAISDGYTEPQIKRLQRVPFSRPSEVKIISDNPALETFTVELDRLTIIGRICGHIARK
ncbi:MULTISPECIES: LexA family transcriptional regulator [unclassified Rhizobium]|uniref:LexA family transcriptional regulator n=1 Tax=unclassified Rhizobium TaxID=2613769 RepID=UPI001619E8A5|nr:MULTISPECIES: LexA family transcriptional regulator [unclassified Rhizobium]MBB3381779.1 phage repressor protein C with HTH and peptisase S24 domain [Rhizobium sp. BK098]MBB3566770.1 phage repressor protein C with HTH and peptisase S24 domain [Rhizobium sp. BK491]MBB3613481.1 phage repressor protein C with HTH and peptisase S24 domain [Rhizobium sp. BK609]MBB3679139.1 phage repressor protein C with HTH and peptisase S24 domain [Rhizobium sp. BK612]